MSNIDLDIQRLTTKFVSESKYPTSIIALRNGLVVGIASSYGTDYPFVSKANVGSTLKPFIYCHLRENGVSPLDEFDSIENTLDWDVREVSYHKSCLNLREALLYSNNNSFLNAVDKIGMDNTLEFLSNLLNKSESDIFPSTVLGATRSGITLYELALTYSRFFNPLSDNLIKKECLSIMNEILVDKIGFKIENAFLKTGTTNENRERYAVLGNSDLVFAVLRNENRKDDFSKEGSFIKQISRFMYNMFKSKNDYSWV